MRKARVMLVLVAVLCGSPAALARRSPRVFQYFGWHPVPARHGGRFCYFDGAHTHPFRPSPRGKFRASAGYSVFLGDPTTFRYEGRQYAFDGPHPVPNVPSPLVCRTRGLHRHFFEPPRTPDYREHDGVAHYEGLDARGRDATRGVPVAAAASPVAATAAPSTPTPPPVDKTPPPAITQRTLQAARRPVQPSGKPREFIPREDDD